MPRNSPLALELLRQLAFVAVIPIIVTIAFFIWQLFPQLKQNIIDEQQSIAGLVAQQTRSRIVTAEEQVKVFIALSAENYQRSISDHINSFVQSNSHFDSVYLLTLQGAITDISIKNTKPEIAHKLYENMDISHSSIYKNKNLFNDSGWTEVFLSIVTGRLSIAYYTQIGNNILIAELDINRLPKISEDLHKLGILVMLLDGRKQLIAHPDSELSQQQINLSNLDIFKSPQEGNVRSGTFDWQGKHYFGTHIEMESLGWSVIVSEDESMMNKTLYLTLQSWMGSMVLILIVALFVAFRRSRDFNQRFSLLNQHSKDVAQGRYDTRRQIFKIKEFQELSNNLSTMAEAIQKREQSLHDKESELRNLNAELEQRVSDRTQELSATNEELKDTIKALNSTMDQLVQSEKLASLGSLVAGVAHELNTPIGNANVASSSLNDFARSIQDKLEQGSITKSSLNEFLDDAILATNITSRNLERAAELITSFKHVAADQSSSQRRKFSLSELLHENLITLHPQTKKKPVEISTDIDSEIKLDSYPGPLGQVLSNLIINALVHGFEDKQTGKILISAELVDENKITICVEDNGKGIDFDKISRVFDPFFTTKLGQGGSGLGLHICHNIVTEILGGQIEVHSEPNRGTIFTLTYSRKCNECYPAKLEA